MSNVESGGVVVVRRLTAAPEVNQRLREMGFGEARQVKVLSGRDPLLCQVCNARLGLNLRLASTILVERVPVRAVA